ncbi:hypothetical protein TWF696_006454 [Orbilia brochopaga]|uniref:BTB domain-containing protein n=1 Tax=Orbilia brochopaga TaxID=3140254 RepID=A0AAV9UXL3_9PEZI
MQDIKVPAAGAVLPERPRSLPETIIRAYGLRELLPPLQTRVEALLAAADDVVFKPEDGGGEEVRTFGALFSVAAAAKGRPAIPVDRYGTVAEEDADGMKVLKCSQEQMEKVRAVQEVVAKQTVEMLSRLLDEVQREIGEKSAAQPDFTIQLEEEEEKEEKVVANVKTTKKTQPRTPATRPQTKKPSSSNKSTASTTRQAGVSAATSASDDGSTTYADIQVHRAILTASVPYYKYLSLRTVRFSDTTSDTSTLPHPTITPYSLRVIQTWLYSPLRIGEVLEAAEPHAHLYLLATCKRQDRNGYPPPLTTVRGLVEVARAADYLGMEELARWTARLLRRLCHGLDKCTGNRCRATVPFVLERIWESGGLGLPSELVEDLKRYIASHPDTMWKRPVIALPDALIEGIVEAFADVIGQTQTVTSVLEISRDGEVKRKWKKDDPAGEPLVWWDAFTSVNKVRAAVKTATGVTFTQMARWDEKLLGPVIERCVHELAKGFDDTWLSDELMRKMEGNSFERELVVDLLMMVTTTSVVAVAEGLVPFARPPLNRKTVRAVFEGMVNLRKWDGWDSEWMTLERRVVQYLQREWMTIAVNGENGGFAAWRPAMLTVASRKMRVAIDDLLGKNQTKPMARRPQKGKAIVKDRLGNDVEVDATTLTIVGKDTGKRATVLRPEAEEFRLTTPAALRPEAQDFVPSGALAAIYGTDSAQ